MMSSLGELVAVGPDGPRIRPLGLGTWQWGDRLTWGYGQGYGEADLEGAFRAALEGGIEFFDTAEIYGRGRSERLLGRLRAGLGDACVAPTGQSPAEGVGGPLIATKFFPYPWRLRRGDLRRALRGSLQRLGVKRIDLYQIHWPFPPVPIETWMAALAEAVEDGLVGAVGVSNYSAQQTRRAAAALARRGVPLTSNQVEYSLLRRQVERNGVLETCRQLGVTVIAYSPLAMGLLGGRYSADRRPPGWRGLRYRRLGPAPVDALVGLLREIGGAYGGKTPSQVALNWLICQGVVPIPGAKNAQQARENAGALGWRLAGDELAALERASAAF